VNEYLLVVKGTIADLILWMEGRVCDVRRGVARDALLITATYDPDTHSTTATIRTSQDSTDALNRWFTEDIHVLPGSGFDPGSLLWWRSVGVAVAVG
jgi:hypothetical protein